MALRDRIIARTAPFLPEGEWIEHVFLAQTAHPFKVGLLGPILLGGRLSYRVVAVTDTAIHVLTAGSVRTTTPKRLLRTIDRATRIGPVQGLWAPITLGDERLWVGVRFHKEVRAADEWATPGTAVPPKSKPPRSSDPGTLPIER